MPDLLRIIAFWWKKIVLLALAALILTAGFLLLQPKLYMSVTTALPANSATLDKARIYNQNIEQLYPALGTAEELDKFLGIVSLESLYNQLVLEHGLAAHYRLTEKDASEKLRTRITVSRSKWNDLKIKVWDTDPQMAARLANAFLGKAEAVYQNLQQQNNRTILNGLKQDLAQKEMQLERMDTVRKPSSSLTNLRLKGLEQQVSQLQQLINEYTMSVQTPLPLLLVAEKAYASTKPDKPKVLQTLAFVLFAALSFGLLVVVFIESRKQHEAPLR